MLRVGSVVYVLTCRLWYPDEFKLFELATDMSRNQTNFYQWLDIEVHY